MYSEAAAFYDLIHDARDRDPFAEAEVVINEVRLRNPQARTLLDVACGTGANLRRFSESFEVVGLDASAEMLAIAREKYPHLPLVTADMRNFELGRRFDAIVSIFSGIGYLLEPADLRRAIATMAGHLTSGGVLMLEGWVEPDRWMGSTVSVDAVETPGLALARVTRSTRDGLRTEWTSRYVAATNAGLETIDEHHVMRLSDPEEFASAYRQAGLRFERLSDLLRPGRSVYVGVEAS
ncbi:MAG: class I SAM-dependent methyltransferase [Acidimicrobiales bacterium]